THRSFAYENGGLPSNERLEFLGDSVLGIVVTDRLYRDHPDLPEGELAKIRAATVSQRALAVVARQLGLGAFVLLGRGETSTGGNDKDSILCDTLEAVFGAIYLAHGIEVARKVILNLVGPSLVTAASAGVALDWKTSLQEACAAAGLGSPIYDVTGEGPDHARTFTARVVVDGVVRSEGTGTAKKLAEQEAAERAFAVISALSKPAPTES
ncbi:ribonuclease III, partial [Mycolicibacterium sp.]|uniref:ribonuclease III n=1 Tax=Mycolicibacterium sp. TaxID=2320850 RepID=UPI0037C64DFD